MLLHQPRRTALLTGKLAAMLTFAAGTLAVTEAVTWIAARLLASGAGVATGAWTSVDAADVGGHRLRRGAGVDHRLRAARDGARGRRALGAGRAGDRDRVGGTDRAPRAERVGRRRPLVPRPAARGVRRRRDERGDGRPGDRDGGDLRDRRRDRRGAPSSAGATSPPEHRRVPETRDRTIAGRPVAVRRTVGPNASRIEET